MTAALTTGNSARPVYVVETTTSSAAAHGNYVVEKLAAQTLAAPKKAWNWNAVAATFIQVIPRGWNVLRPVLWGVLRGDPRPVA